MVDPNPILAIVAMHSFGAWSSLEVEHTARSHLAWWRRKSRQLPSLYWPLRSFWYCGKPIPEPKTRNRWISCLLELQMKNNKEMKLLETHVVHSKREDAIAKISLTGYNFEEDIPTCLRTPKTVNSSFKRLELNVFSRFWIAQELLSS